MVSWSPDPWERHSSSLSNYGLGVVSSCDGYSPLVYPRTHCRTSWETRSS